MGILKRAAAFLLAGMVAVTALAGCGQGAADVESGAVDFDYPVEVRDVTISGEPEGVAVLSPEIGDAVLAMGYEITLKARTTECRQTELSVLPEVSADNPAKIAETGATVALTCEELTEEQSQSFQDAGVTVVSVPAATGREDLARFYGEVGAVLRGGNTGYTHGQEIAGDIFLRIDDVLRVIPENSAPVTACYLFDTQGGAVTGDQLANKLIEAAGLTNGVYSSTDGQIDMQTLTIANPTYIFCPIGVADQLAAAEGYRDLTAVQEGRVYEIDEQLIRSQGWGMLDAAIAIAGAVYPELIGEETSEPQEEGGESSSGTDGESSASSESSGDTEMRSVLQIGDTGEDVRRLQERLDELGYMYLPSTGEFGEGTEQAIKDFQLLNGYAATGIADETTQEVLFSDNVRTGPYYGQ